MHIECWTAEGRAQMNGIEKESDSQATSAFSSDALDESDSHRHQEISDTISTPLLPFKKRRK